MLSGCPSRVWTGVWRRQSVTLAADELLARAGLSTAQENKLWCAMKKTTNIRLRAGLIITLMMLALLTAPLMAKEQRVLETDSLVSGKGQDR